jgi:hypothetical protein
MAHGVASGATGERLMRSLLGTVRTVSSERREQDVRKTALFVGDLSFGDLCRSPQ